MIKKLKDICSFQSGGTPSKNNPDYFDGTIPWITTVALNGKHIGNEEAVAWITEKAIQESTAKIVPANSIMVGTRVGIGKVAINTVPMSTSQDIISLINIDESLWDKDYLCKFIQSKNSVLNAQARGATIKGIKIEALGNLPIPILPKEQQHQIVLVLNGIASIIKERSAELESLDFLIKARFVEMFGDPVINPMGWKQKRFDEICENLDSKRKPITASEREEGPYPYYGASGIVDYVADYIFDENILLVSEDGANLLMRSTPIAFSVSGKVWVNNHAHVVRFRDMYLQKYIEIAFSLIEISDCITGSAQPKLNQAKLNAMLFSVPDEEKLKAYLTFVNQIDKSKVVVQEALNKAQMLFDSLMQQYFG